MTELAEMRCWQWGYTECLFPGGCREPRETHVHVALPPDGRRTFVRYWDETEAEARARAGVS